MRILLFGSQGQVGWELSRALLPLGEVIPITRAEADFGKPDALRSVVRSTRPDLIINAAAYTAVDAAEANEEEAFIVNALAPGILAEEAKRQDALLIHYSTDYVFDGESTTPYTESDSPSPLNAYGRSKLAGETAIPDAGGEHLILRTSWVYGVRGHNFLLTLLRLAREREQLRIVADQFGAPTWSRWIADATAHIAWAAMARRHEGAFTSGLYHLACAGETSWHGFASAIVEQFQQRVPYSVLKVKNIIPIATSEYPLPARRPRNSRLDCTKLMNDYGVAAPDWRCALDLCLEDVLASYR